MSEFREHTSNRFSVNGAKARGNDVFYYWNERESPQWFDKISPDNTNV